VDLALVAADMVGVDEDVGAVGDMEDIVDDVYMGDFNVLCIVLEI
jgi:hypothetical protein